VVGIERYPRKVTGKMSQKRISRKSHVKPFVKFVNYNHMMPTRFVMKDDLDFKNVVTEEKVNGGAEQRKNMKKEIKKQLEQR
jgi:large subunit ribosomal protein L27e